MNDSWIMLLFLCAEVKTRTSPFHIVSTMPADVPAMHVARTSAGMLLTQFNCNISLRARTVIIYLSMFRLMRTNDNPFQGILFHTRSSATYSVVLNLSVPSILSQYTISPCLSPINSVFSAALPSMCQLYFSLVVLNGTTLPCWSASIFKGAEFQESKWNFYVIFKRT